MQPITTLGSPHNAMHSPSYNYMHLHAQVAMHVVDYNYTAVVLTHHNPIFNYKLKLVATC